MCVPATGHRGRGILLSLGMLCLAVSLGSRALDLTFGLRPDPLDFVRGLLLGVSIAFSLQAVWLGRRARRNGSLQG